MNEALKLLYKKMAEHTLPECSRSCRVPYSCCDKLYCDIAQQYAKEHGQIFVGDNDKKAPMLGAHGCIIPPHLRPICTMHTCDINSLGFKRNDQPWTEKYYALREEIETLELEELERKDENTTTC